MSKKNKAALQLTEPNLEKLKEINVRYVKQSEVDKVNQIASLFYNTSKQNAAFLIAVRYFIESHLPEEVKVNIEELKKRIEEFNKQEKLNTQGHGNSIAL